MALIEVYRSKSGKAKVRKRKQYVSPGVYSLVGHFKIHDWSAAMANLKRKGLIKKGTRYKWVLSAKGTNYYNKIYR